MSLISEVQPPNQISRPDFIPYTLRYLCGDVPYDYKPGGFRDFPERQGWTVYGESGRPVMSKFTLRDGTDASLKLAEKVALLQAWMFFGVIAEASTIYGLKINVEDEFISSTDGHKIVLTAPLNELPVRWIHAAGCMQEGLKDRCSRIWELCQYLEPRIFNLRDEDNKVRLYTYDESETLLSVEIVYRVLLLSLARTGTYDAIALRPLLKAKFFDHQLRLHRRGWRDLQKQGWCRSEMRMLSALNRELPYAFFAATLKRHPLDHSGCDEFRCIADQVNEATYENVHVEHGCACNFVHVDVHELCSVLSSGEVPLILVSQNLKVKIVKNCSFVAISHVWSHGLGNPRENAIPLCQLQRIRDHIATLDESFQLGLSDPESACTFWLDTLCIPVNPDLKAHRKTAIKLMGRTYRDASAVLVLDRELKEVDTRTTSFLEQSLWLVFSGWMRRLWTLQEGALANDLFIMMKDGPQRFARPDDGGLLSANKWKRAKLASEMDDIEKDVLLYRELELFIQRRVPLARYLQEADDSREYQPPYQYLCAATERRCTSKSEDEPLILATMMGHNVGRIVEQDDAEARMALWHQEIRLIPAEIIFLHTDIRRLSKSPFRWAPASLMENEFAAALYRGVGVCDSEGLHVQYAGYILSEEQERIAAATEARWYLRDRENNTVHKILHGMKRVLPRRCAILFDLEYSGSGAAVEILDERRGGLGSEMTYVGTVVGRVSFFKKLGMGPGKVIKSGRDVIDCKRTEVTQRWCIT